MAKKKKFPPNWKDPDAYPDPNETDGCQWAWEFIRRNPEYHEDYKILTKAKKEGSGNIRTRYGFGLSAYDPPIKPDESKEQYMARMVTSNNGTHRIISLEEYLCNKWILWRGLIDPKENYSSKVKVLDINGGVRDIGTEEEIIDDLEPNFPDLFVKENEVLLAFDLDKPIPKLLDDAKSLLEYRQEKMKPKPKAKRSQFQLYPTYLRLLDAKKSEATDKEIAKVIFPELDNEYPEFKATQRVRDNLAAADQLLKSGFRFLPD